ncbi:hypothetical protein A2975_01070 [Candidatus Woesebacteria bacterium RIFCSPLOWO2_01_FULL_44_14]|uniref:Uncharacterized protein n=1 Tax=Candidatus Woesebacteria bacterium RIFCSPLOWO2_01_FULL_44_14 TaxID=1802525 RepID=A0A1F8C030_9BACT|nr:MAG: hypothetical protein A2975_01070 [Candidatus Woesebacteria bacterium RIFCSPLOWO2_01_FULL_44_14]
MAKEKRLEEKKTAKREFAEKIKERFDFKTRWKDIRFKKTIVFATIVLVGFIWIFWGLPLPTNLGSKNFPVSTKIFDRNGELIYEIFTDQRRSPIKLDEVPEYVKDATIAIEDKDFYKHYGLSIQGMGRAVYRIVFNQRLQGGSTLTQQLVKNSLLTPQRTIRRKIREIVLSLIVETLYTKDQILEMYLNQIPYGGTAYGIEAASELYFNKAARDLTLGEAALLAGLPQAPSRYSPFGANPENAKGRQETVLRRMVEDGYLSQEEAEAAKQEEFTYAKAEAPKAPHFALWVKQQLAEEYGEALVEQGGLRVTTTLDLELQEVAQQAVADEVGKLAGLGVGNGAALVTRPGTGEILAMVGSKDYFAEDEDGKVNITLAKRQPGSSIKPLNYALAIRDGKITPATALADVPTCFAVAGQPAYCPRNYDGSFHGAVQARFALGNSYNVPAVRVLALNGVENFVGFAKDMGLTTLEDPKNYGLSLTLGGGEVRPKDMAVAFGVFANQGIKQPLTSVLKVEDYKGKTLFKADLDNLEGDRVLSPAVSFIISHILLDNNARSSAFGESSFLNVRGHPEVSVKTGTTNDLRDNWTIGYNTHALVVTWVGNNDNAPMSGAVSGVSGASPIWNKIMRETLDKAEDGAYNPDDEGHAWPRQPSDVIGANVCWVSGKRPTGSAEDPGCAPRFEYFLKDYLPEEGGEIRLDIPVDKTTGEIGRPDTPPENVEIQNHSVIYDPLGTIVCTDCILPTEPITVKP